MSIRVDLLALEPSIPGQARLVIKKWQGSSEQLEFSIKRNQDQYYLQEGQNWSVSPFWFKVARITKSNDGEELETLVGPEVVDPLLEGGGFSNYLLELRSQDGSSSDHGVLRPGSGLLLSASGGVTPPSGGSTQLVDPIETSQEPEMIVRNAPVESAKKRKPRVLPLIIVLILLILLAVAAAWFWLYKPKADTNTSATGSAAGVTTSSASSEAYSPCSVENMGSMTELAFLQACLKQEPESAELLEVISIAKGEKHCGIAQRLYANRSQAGDVEIAKVYAREYDPKYHQPSECFPAPDAATAAYWYETILSQTPDDAEAKQRLEELRP